MPQVSHSRWARATARTVSAWAVVASLRGGIALVAVRASRCTLRGLRNHLGPDAFKPERCGPLPCTLIHEATHRTQTVFTRKKEKKAEDMEKQCCGL